MSTITKEMETVILEKKGKIGILTLNRPTKLNALNDDILNDLCGMVELDKMKCA